jgi:hypothetical protein
MRKVSLPDADGRKESVTRTRSEGGGTVTETKGGVRGVGTKVDAKAAGNSETGLSDGKKEKRTASPNNDKSALTRPARRAASGSKTAVRDTPPQKPDRKVARVKPAPAGATAPLRKRGKQTAVGRRRPPVAAAPPRRSEPQLEAITTELHHVKAMVQRLVPSAPLPNTNPADAILEGAVDSLRRLLSELIEHRLEAVVRDLAEVRGEASTGSRDGASRVVERLDEVLESLGAVRFEASRFDAVDPLIHVVAEERHEEGIPNGVVLATVRPGFRSGRGLVLCKATVAVNRGA